MSEKFVETGQTFTPDGAAYCPVEERDRGVAGVFASLAVLVGGAGFLAYAMASAGGSAGEREIAAEMAAAEINSVPDSIAPDAGALKTGPAIANVDEPASGPAPTEPAPLETEPADRVADALAASRAARAGAEKESYEFNAPTLKARAVATDASLDSGADGFAPSLKPSVRKVLNELTSAQAVPLPELTPIGLSPVSQPVIEPAAIMTAEAPAIPLGAAPAIAFANDLSRDVVEATIKIAKGETFVDALKRAGVAATDRNASAYAFGEHYNLRRLRPDQEFRLTLGWPNQTLFQLAEDGEPEARLLSLEFRNGYEEIITVRRAGVTSFEAEAAPIPLTTQLHAVQGRIDGSLYMSAKTLGAPDDIIAGLADAFAYDVDFQREIFGGDTFEVIFEARYDDRGRMASGGDIVFAHLNWRGRSREKGYYRFDPDGDSEKEGADFYDAAGQSAKRLLMKTPIDGARLSSRFGTRRHPILGYRRAHKGVDFAANRGTPIKAAGDGVVERADRYGSFGNYVRIRHANGYQTAYAHLNGFRTGIRKGKRVRQGDVIGYVGTTGRSTGPHLHYEVHLNGTAVNPQNLKIATGKQLKGEALLRFKAERDRIDALRAQSRQEPPLFAQDETEGPDKL